MRLPRVVAKQVGLHRPDCFAVAAVERGDWPTSWSIVDDEQSHVWANRFANRDVKQGRDHVYLNFRCNDTRCTAHLWVSLSAILERFGASAELLKREETHEAVEA